MRDSNEKANGGQWRNWCGDWLARAGSSFFAGVDASVGERTGLRCGAQL